MLACICSSTWMRQTQLSCFGSNSTIDSFSLQSVWSGWTIILRICPMEQLALSVTPSICGWNAVDIIGLVPTILWTSHQNLSLDLIQSILVCHGDIPPPWHISMLAWRPLLWCSLVSGALLRLVGIWLPIGSYTCSTLGRGLWSTCLSSSRAW